MGSTADLRSGELPQWLLWDPRFPRGMAFPATAPPQTTQDMLILGRHAGIVVLKAGSSRAGLGCSIRIG